MTIARHLAERIHAFTHSRISGRGHVAAGAERVNHAFIDAIGCAPAGTAEDAPHIPMRIPDRSRGAMPGHDLGFEPAHQSAGRGTGERHRVVRAGLRRCRWRNGRVSLDDADPDGDRVGRESWVLRARPGVGVCRGIYDGMPYRERRAVLSLRQGPAPDGDAGYFRHGRGGGATVAFDDRSDHRRAWHGRVLRGGPESQFRGDDETVACRTRVAERTRHL